MAVDAKGLLSEREGIQGFEIGQMLAAEEGIQMIGYRGEVTLPQFARDELARYFAHRG